MEMRYERPQPLRKHQPHPDAVPTPEGWRLKTTGELLVSILGLPNAKPFSHYSQEVLDDAINDMVTDQSNDTAADTGSGNQSGATEQTDGSVVSNPEGSQEPADTQEKPVQEGVDGNSGGVVVDPAVFAVKQEGDDVYLELIAPYTHGSTRWTINGVAQEAKGNKVSAKVGDIVVGKSAKGEFTATL